MKKHLFLSLISVFIFCFQLSAQSYIGFWERVDETGNMEYLEFDADSMYSFTYQYTDSCFHKGAFKYTDLGDGQLSFNVNGFDVFLSYAVNSSVLSIHETSDPSQTINFSSSITDQSSLALCIPLPPPPPPGPITYIGKWIVSGLPLRYVEFTTDSVYIYEFSSDSSCYTVNVATCDSVSSSSLLIMNSPSYFYVSSANEMTFNNPILGSFNLNRVDFDVSTWVECSDDNWACTATGCVENSSGAYSTEAECVAACDTSSGGGTNYSYLDMWNTTIDSVLTYIHFTNDSILIYQFDSADCYTYNSLIYTDIGNNQLQVATVFNSTYSFGGNGDTLSIGITGLGDLVLVRDSFNVNSWVKCTYNWKCNPTGCADVGSYNGTYNSQSDCVAACDSNISITEYFIDVLVYPNPFENYTTLSFNKQVKSYQLYDATGRLVLEKGVVDKVELLYKNDLKTGLYLLRFIGEQEVGVKRLMID